MKDVIQSAAGRVDATAPATAMPPEHAASRIRHRLVAIRFHLVVLAALTVVAAGQIVEDANDSPPLQLLSPGDSIARWTVIVVVAYMLLVLKVLEPAVQRALGSLRGVARIPSAQFDAYAREMRHSHRRSDLVLLAVSALIVIGLFPVGNVDLPTTNDPVTGGSEFLPAGLGGLVVMAGYIVVGWTGLSLIHATIRMAQTLGRLAREPLDINVFDTSNLLPFGRVALAIALAPAGVIAIFLFGLGQPNGPLPWAVLLLATGASILALLLPLRGVHHQMWVARQKVLRTLNRQLTEMYDHLQASGPGADAELGAIGSRTGTLIPLRKLVSDMTTWPFQDTIAFARAVLIASAPLIYTALNELIRIFLISPLGH